MPQFLKEIQNRLTPQKSDNAQSTLNSLNVIGIKSNMDRMNNNVSIVILTFLMTLATLYSLVRIEFDSFKIMEDFYPGIYGLNGELSKFNFTPADITKMHFVLFSGAVAICFVNGLKKNVTRYVASLFIIYIVYFGFHYKYVINGYFHFMNKAIYAVTTQRGRIPDEYYVPPFELIQMKLELKYFLYALVFGVCFLLAYAGVNHCNPIVFTLCVSCLSVVPFVFNTFVGEKYLVCAGIICIVMFLVNIQGYSNYASKKIFVGMGNVVRIRGGYVSYSAFQQAALFLSFTVVVLLVSNSFFDFKNYHRNEKLDEFGKKIIYAIQNLTDSDGFGNFNSKPGGLNNGDLKNMGDLNYTGEIMFDIKVKPSESVAPFYFRAYAAGEYKSDKWSTISKKIYEEQDFWSSFEKEDFYPQLCSEYLTLSGQSRDLVEISIRNKEINPKIFLNEYRSVASEINVIDELSFEYDNAFEFSTLGGVENYRQKAVIGNIFSNKDVLIDKNSYDTNYYNMMKYGVFSTASELSEEIYYEDREASALRFRNNEQQYRAFVMDNYCSYPDNIEEWLPEGFDSSVQDIFYSCSNSGYDGELEYYYDYDIYSNYNPRIINDYNDRVIDYVRNSVQTATEYSLSPGQTPDDRELVEYFMNENKKGYCVHYATAGTLMLRRAGIPARYVEGYFVSDYDLSRKNSRGYSGIADSNAHAWTEVYYPLIGWQAVDFTPYYSEQTLPEENKNTDSQNSDSDSNNDTETDTDTQTDSDSEISSERDTDSSNGDYTSSDESTDEKISETIVTPVPKQDGGFVKFIKGAVKLLLGILQAVLVLALLAGIWFLARFAVLKIRHIRFNSSDTRKGAGAMYMHSLFILKLTGVHPNDKENDTEFAERATAKLEHIKNMDYQNFTDIALNARFGRNAPDEESITQMTAFLNDLAEDVYSSSDVWRKILMKYILFLC